MKVGQSFMDAHGWLKIRAISGAYVMLQRPRQKPFIDSAKLAKEIIKMRKKK